MTIEYLEERRLTMLNELSAKELRRSLSLEEIKTDAKLDIPLDFVGQERAISALELGLSSESKFHIAVV